MNDPDRFLPKAEEYTTTSVATPLVHNLIFMPQFVIHPTFC